MALQTVLHLQREHREAERLLGALEGYLRFMRVHPDSDSRRVSSLVEFLSESFFLRHEEKEEGILLPELIRGGCRADARVLAKLHEEHERGHRQLHAFRSALRMGYEWTAAEREQFLQLGEEWREFILGHMKREELYFFPGVSEWLNAETDEWVSSQFEKLDREFESNEDSQRMREAAEAFVVLFENGEPSLAVI